MISLVLSKLYRIILENNINTWIEIHGKRDQGQVGIKSYHSTVDYLVTLRSITKECHNNRINIPVAFPLKST